MRFTASIIFCIASLATLAPPRQLSAGEEDLAQLDAALSANEATWQSLKPFICQGWVREPSSPSVAFTWACGTEGAELFRRRWVGMNREDWRRTETHYKQLFLDPTRQTILGVIAEAGDERPKVLTSWREQSGDSSLHTVVSRLAIKIIEEKPSKHSEPGQDIRDLIDSISGCRSLPDQEIDGSRCIGFDIVVTGSLAYAKKYRLYFDLDHGSLLRRLEHSTVYLHRGTVRSIRINELYEIDRFQFSEDGRPYPAAASMYRYDHDGSSRKLESVEFSFQLNEDIPSQWVTGFLSEHSLVRTYGFGFEFDVMGKDGQVAEKIRASDLTEHLKLEADWTARLPEAAFDVDLIPLPSAPPPPPCRSANHRNHIRYHTAKVRT